MALKPVDTKNNQVDFGRTFHSQRHLKMKLAAPVSTSIPTKIDGRM